MSGSQETVSILLNEQIEPVVVPISEPMSVRSFMKHADEVLRGNTVSKEDGSTELVGQHEDYSTFTSVWNSLKGDNSTRKPLVNGFQTRYGYPRALKGGELLSFQGKGDNGV